MRSWCQGHEICFGSCRQIGVWINNERREGRSVVEEERGKEEWMKNAYKRKVVSRNEKRTQFERRLKPDKIKGRKRVDSE